MEIKIKKGKHYSNPLMFKIYKDLKKLDYILDISKANKYKGSLQQTEQLNKLPGVTDGLWRHKNEFRFAWRHNESLDCFDLFAYFYIDGKIFDLPTIEDKLHLGSYEYGDSLRLTINFSKGFVTFCVDNFINQVRTSVEYKKKRKFGFGLGFYNGGKETYDKDFYFGYYEKEKKHLFMQWKGFY